MTVLVTSRVTPARVLLSEWTKLRSLRSTWLTLGLAMLLSVGIAAAAGAAIANELHSAPGDKSVANAINISLFGMNLTSMIFGVLGVLQLAGEYGTGMIRASLTAVPRRLPVLFGKAVILTGVAGVVALATSFASFAVTQAFLSNENAAASLGDPGVLPALFGAAAAATAAGLIGLALAAILRNTAGALATLMAILFVVPALVPVLPEKISKVVEPYLPSSAAKALYALDQGPHMLSPGAGAAVLAAFLVVLLGVGASLLARRDA